MTENTQTDESINTGAGGTSSSARAIINDKSKGILLALSIMVNIVAAGIIYQDLREQRLKQYDLDDFKSRGFAELNGEVQMHDKLINVLLIRKECLK
jgi:hypothetical protein